MKIAIDLKNTSRGLKPKNDDVIIFDSKEKQWYITTKEELLKEDKKLLDECKNQLKANEKEVEKMRKEYSEFKVKVAEQLFNMSEVMKKIVGKEN